MYPLSKGNINLKFSRRALNVFNNLLLQVKVYNHLSSQVVNITLCCKDSTSVYY